MPKKVQKLKVGDLVQVWWKEEQQAYNGEVKSLDAASPELVEIQYEDGERGWLNLSKDIWAKTSKRFWKTLDDKVRECDGDVPKQLGLIGAALSDMADRVPSIAVSSSRAGWWNAWEGSIVDAVEAGNVVFLAQLTGQFASQLRASVTTAWWRVESDRWRERLRRVTRSEELVSCLEELKTEAINWAKARQLFPPLEGTYNGRGRIQKKGEARMPRSEEARVLRSKVKDPASQVVSPDVNKVVDASVEKKRGRGRPRKDYGKKLTEQDVEQGRRDLPLQKATEPVEIGSILKENEGARDSKETPFGGEKVVKEVGVDIDDGQGKDSLIKIDHVSSRVSSQSTGGRAEKTSVNGLVRGGLSNRLKRNVKQGKQEDEDATSSEIDADSKVGTPHEAVGKKQLGRNGIKRAARSGKEALVREDVGAHSGGDRQNAQATRYTRLKSAKGSRGTKQHARTSEEESSSSEDSKDDGGSKDAMNEKENIKEGRKRASAAGKESTSEDDSGAPSSRLRRSVRPNVRDGQPKRSKRLRGTRHEVSNSEEEMSPLSDSEEDSAGEARLEQAMGKGQPKETPKRGRGRPRKRAEFEANVGASSRLTRSASGKEQRRINQDVSDKEEDSSDGDDSTEDSAEGGTSDDAMSDSSRDSRRGKHGKRRLRREYPARTRSSKRKSDENDGGVGKKLRRAARGHGESDEENASERSEDSSSSSEDQSDDSGGDSSSRRTGKQKVSKKEKDSAIKSENPPEDEASSEEEDEEICSVCEFAGAANMMLLCDGEDCEEAFHSFCLKFPLQSIPQGDWLCSLCLYEKCELEKTGKIVKRTPKLRAELIPPLKMVEAIVGCREDPSMAEVDTYEDRELQYLVKWSSLSHRHDTWVPEEWLLFADKTRLFTYQRKYSVGDGDELSDERRSEWEQIDRIIACRNQAGYCESSPAARDKGSRSRKMKYLVKWTNVEYNGSTWEEENEDDDMQEAIKRFKERHELAERKAHKRSTERAVALAMTGQPKYVSGGVLHDYQLQGLKWLVSNYQQQKNVILADEMGLGKTIQAVSLIMALKHENISNKPVLVIGPKSTLVGWEQELRQWGADLNSVIYQGDKESRTIIRNYEFYTKEKTPLFDVLVTSYDLAMNDNTLLQKFKWSCIIVDEGHRVKNMRSKLGVLLKRQTADFRILLTGTPVQNTLTELFALLHFLDPVEFPDPERSAQEFAQVDAKNGAGSKEEVGIEQQISRLHELLRPRMLRRLKAEVMQGTIPGKKTVEVMCALTPLQRHLYGATLKKNYKVLNRGITTGKKRSLNNILVELRMICNHPYLIPAKEPEISDPDESFRLLVGASGKLQLLEKLLPKLKDGGHRVLLFSQMTKLLDILEDFLSHLSFKFCRIDGTTVACERQKKIAEFNSLDSDTFIFLISTRAGGLGINLPSADTVIIYDPDFNPFVDLQAQARAHRIGQVNVVLVYQLLTKFSVEEKIIERSKQKLAMENLVMSSNERDTVDDVNTLLLHGARKVLEEHDVEAASVKWTDESLELLMNRDISDTKDVKEGGAGYLGAIQEPGGILGGRPVDGSPLKTGREWEELLGKLAEQDMEAEEGKLGRGKRQRKKIQYRFEPNIDAHGDEEDVQDPVEDDPSISGGSSSSSGSDSDVSLDNERGLGSRGPYLTKTKAMKGEQGASIPPSQQCSDQMPHQVAVLNPPTLDPVRISPTIHPALSHVGKFPEHTNVYQLPSGYPLVWERSTAVNSSSETAVPSSSQSPVGISQSQQHSQRTPYQVAVLHPPTLDSLLISPTTGQSSSHVYQPSPGYPSLLRNSTMLSSSSTVLPSGNQSLGASRTHPTGLNPHHWNAASASSGSSQGSKPLWEHLSPHIHISTSASVSVSQTYQQLQPPPASPRESPNPVRSQVYRSSDPYLSASQKSLGGSTSNNMKVTVTSSTNQQGTSPFHGLTATPELDKQHFGSSFLGPKPHTSSFGPNAAHFAMPRSHSLPYVTNGKPLEVVVSQASLPDGAVLKGAFSQQANEQFSSADYQTLAEVLRRTGSKLSGSQATPRSQVLEDAKSLSLEDVLRQTGSMLAGTKQTLPAGSPSQPYQDANDKSGSLLWRAGSRDTPREAVLKRSTVLGSKDSLSSGTPSHFLLDPKSMSLEEVLRQTGSTGTPTYSLNDPKSMSLEQVLIQTGSQFVGSKTAVSPTAPVPFLNAHKTALGVLPCPDILTQKESSAKISSQTKSATGSPSLQVSQEATSNSFGAVSQQSGPISTETKQVDPSRGSSRVPLELVLGALKRSSPPSLQGTPGVLPSESQSEMQDKASEQAG